MYKFFTLFVLFSCIFTTSLRSVVFRDDVEDVVNKSKKAAMELPEAQSVGRILLYQGEEVKGALTAIAIAPGKILTCAHAFNRISEFSKVVFETSAVRGGSDGFRCEINDTSKVTFLDKYKKLVEKSKLNPKDSEYQFKVKAYDIAVVSVKDEFPTDLIYPSFLESSVEIFEAKLISIGCVSSIISGKKEDLGQRDFAKKLVHRKVSFNEEFNVLSSDGFCKISKNDSVYSFTCNQGFSEIEAYSSPGDSGNPGFLLVEGKYYLASIHSSKDAWGVIQTDSRYNLYRDHDVFLPFHLNWIKFQILGEEDEKKSPMHSKFLKIENIDSNKN